MSNEIKYSNDKYINLNKNLPEIKKNWKISIVMYIIEFLGVFFFKKCELDRPILLRYSRNFLVFDV